MFDKPVFKSKTFNTESKTYPKMTVEFWNVDYAKVIVNLLLKRPQRIQVAWPELGTMYEVMIVPLDNKWNETRMTGTGKLGEKDNPYFFVGIIRHGCYTFRFDQIAGADYIGNKLGIGEPEAIGMRLLFKVLGKK